MICFQKIRRFSSFPAADGEIADFQRLNCVLALISPGRTDRVNMGKHGAGSENGKTFPAASAPTFLGRFESHMQMKATFQFPNESATNLIYFTGRGPPYPRGILSIETKIPIFIPPLLSSKFNYATAEKITRNASGPLLPLTIVSQAQSAIEGRSSPHFLWRIAAGETQWMVFYASPTTTKRRTAPQSPLAAFSFICPL